LRKRTAFILPSTIMQLNIQFSWFENPQCVPNGTYFPFWGVTTDDPSLWDDLTEMYCDLLK
jgi:hypothetical protein